MKVLVSAYACEPDKGSEPGVGWNWVCAIAANHEVWVCTKGNNRESIERELRTHPNNNLHFVYVDVPRALSFWKKGQRGIYLYYYLWQVCALSHAIRLHRTIHFDLGHHITFVNAWIWTFLALMPIPFVWGPIGTNRIPPSCLLPNLRERIRYQLRYFIQSLIRSIDPLYWMSAIRAELILVINEDTGNLFPLRQVAKDKIRIEPAIGSEVINDSIVKDQREGMFNILYAGRFISIKGAHLAVEAFAEFSKRRDNVHLTIIGKGPLEELMRQLVMKNHVEDRVAFIEWMPRDAMLRLMKTADVFLFPSMEGSGMVILEAMAAGIPVVCLNWGGPGTMIDDACGIRVDVGGHDDTIRSLAKALEYLYDNPDVIRKMSISAIARVSEKYTWSKKIHLINKYYKDVCSCP
ncbi:MAG TPA: glycosyltransferase [Deltaproteobacteria bacterium]|nr:glycosyltransferase [Deltaproteobacteria bacterium]